MDRVDPVEAMADARHEFGEHGGVNMSIEASTTFTVLEAQSMPEIFRGHLGPDHGGCYLYGRHFNPTVIALARQLAAMEGTEAAYGTASGISAVAGALLRACVTGDHIVSSRAIYGGTFALLDQFLPKRAGIDTTFVDIAQHDAVRAAFTDKTRVLYIETISNPTLVVADLEALAAIAHEHDALLIVDNTFSPLILRPADFGADVVVHSMTKFISGASDVIAGAVCGSDEFIRGLMDLHDGALMLLGPTMDPVMAFHLALRLPHLPLRMTEHSRRALEFALRMQARGLKVTYPGLPEHPQYELLTRMHAPAYGYGGLLTLDVGTSERAGRLMESLQNDERFGYMAVSLGYFDTLMSCSGDSTSSELDDEQKHEAGIAPGLLRLSIGYTGTLEQRWDQLERALDRLDRS